MNLKQKIIQYAKTLGFNDVKIAKSQILTDEVNRYKQWIASGFNADMHWMERNIDKRADIRLILPEAKSIIVTSFSYFTNYYYPVNLDGLGKISRYAWGDDYHEIILYKLKQIEDFIRLYNENSLLKSYVDTGPILERQWAIKSGLGWQGKNGMIINPKYGSYFFIGIIITNLDLEPDTPIKDMCGSCYKCMEACPTNAIVHQKVVDSSKCLSYWTIESKEDNLPDDIKNNQNNWVFGCDICQEVCPWNRFAKLTSELNFSPRNGETTLSKDFVNYLSEEEFYKRFRKSLIKRAKLKGLKRNFQL